MKLCKLSHCDRKSNWLDMCQLHAQRFLAHGTTELPPKPTPEERFWARVQKSSPEECWLWTGAKQPDGYGQLTQKDRVLAAHRYAYTLVVGEIPDGLEIDHLCRNVACVNPAHLEAVTHAENMRRRVERQTHCINGHEYTPENTYTHPGHRVCRTCRRAAVRRYYARKKASA